MCGLYLPLKPSFEFFFVNEYSLYKFEAKNKGGHSLKNITKNSCSQKNEIVNEQVLKDSNSVYENKSYVDESLIRGFQDVIIIKKSPAIVSAQSAVPINPNNSHDTTRSWILRKWECLSLKLPNLRKHYTLWGLGWSICLCPRNTLFGLYSILQAIPSKEPIMKIQVWSQCKQKSNFSKINTSIYDRTNINFGECCQAFLGI